MSIQDARILIMATDGFEQSELMVPLKKLRESGATVEVAAPAETREEGKIRGWKHGEWGETVDVDRPLDDVNPEDYAALVLPGGQMNPDKLRTEEAAVQIVRDFIASGRVVAAICHGPWLLVEADALQGRKATSYHSIRTDMVNAGAVWEDSEVVIDDGIITSRHPGDLEAFVSKIIEEVNEGRHGQRSAAA